MRLYETTFILSPQADDAAFDRQVKAVTELVNRFKGKIVVEDRWGIRRLAYAIKKYTQGYYTRLVFEGNETLLNELDRFFRLEEAYIRNLTVCFEGQLEEDEKPSEKPAAPVKKPVSVEKPVEKPTAPETKTPVEPKPAKTEPPVSPPVEKATPPSDSAPEKRTDDTDDQL